MHQFGHVYALQRELLDGSAANWFRAMELWHTAREEGLALNTAHYTNMLRQCVQPGAWEAALAVLRQMARDGIRPEVTGVSAALAACVEKKRRREAEKIFAEFSREMLLDSICYLAIIRARMEDADAAGAVEAGKAQLAARVELNPESLSLLLEASDAVGDVAFAEELLQRYQKEEAGRLPQRAAVALQRLSARGGGESRVIQRYLDFSASLTE